jgi:bleomycin hydrolase
VPASVYSGKLPGQKVHDHSKLFKELKNYLKNIEKTNAWNEETVLSTVKSILNSYLGEPPASFEYEGETYTPKEFLKDYLQLNFDDYVDIISLKQYPLYEKVEYTVPDNWWHDASYYNVTLSEYMDIIKRAIIDGYTIVIGGDVSEPGIDGNFEAAVIPDFDIPSEYINEDSRQMRFSNKTTTDDHGIHIVGYKEKEGEMWFLIKDSGSRAFLGPNKGYYFYHEDYIKLKIVDFMIHKDVVQEVLEKFNN